MNEQGPAAKLIQAGDWTFAMPNTQPMPEFHVVIIPVFPILKAHST
jgi:hypothetical protein